MLYGRARKLHGVKDSHGRCGTGATVTTLIIFYDRNYLFGEEFVGDCGPRCFAHRAKLSELRAVI